MKAILSGLVAAPYTPFLPDGGLNLGAIPLLASMLVHNGVTGAFVCGTTGEGYGLTVDERKQVVAAWREAAPPSLKLVVHVGHLRLPLRQVGAAQEQSLRRGLEQIGFFEYCCRLP